MDKESKRIYLQLTGACPDEECASTWRHQDSNLSLQHSALAIRQTAKHV